MAYVILNRAGQFLAGAGYGKETWVAEFPDAAEFGTRAEVANAIRLAPSAYFCRLEEGSAEVEGFPIEVATDTEQADRRRWDAWFEQHRFRGPMGDPTFTPPNPYPEAR